jgi:biopolymer transport protein ExbD
MHFLFHNKKRKKPNDDMALQITSMADIFTIILVFLLKTTAAGINTVSPNASKLPVGNGAEITRDTLKLEISRSSVVVDDKTVLGLRDFEIPVTEVQSNGMSQSVYQALSGERVRRPASPDTSSQLLVLADEETPYSTLKEILASAANSGYVDLQLVVVENN